MCIGIPAEVVSVDEAAATVAVAGQHRRVSALLLPDVQAGDAVLLGGGMILRRLDSGEAAERSEILDEMLRLLQLPGDQPEE